MSGIYNKIDWKDQIICSKKTFWDWSSVDVLRKTTRKQIYLEIHHVWFLCSNFHQTKNTTPKSHESSTVSNQFHSICHVLFNTQKSLSYCIKHFHNLLFHAFYFTKASQKRTSFVKSKTEMKLEKGSNW